MSARHDQALAWLGLDVDSPEAPQVCALVDDGWVVLHASEVRAGDRLVLDEVCDEPCDEVRLVRVADVEHVDGAVRVTTHDGNATTIDERRAVLVRVGDSTASGHGRVGPMSAVMAVEAERHPIDVARLNQFTAWAVNGEEPGPMTDYEAEVFAEIKAEVEADPGAVWSPLFDS